MHHKLIKNVVLAYCCPKKQENILIIRYDMDYRKGMVRCTDKMRYGSQWIQVIIKYIWKWCSAPRVLGFVDWFDSTAHARSRSMTYSSLSSRQFHIWSTSVPRLIHVSSTTRQTQRRPGGGQFNYQLTQLYLSQDPRVNQVQRVYKTTEGMD